jgi:hypothetical protein
MKNLNLFGESFDSESDKINVVYANYVKRVPFSLELFEGFNSLKVLTYSSSIPMIVKMLDKYDEFECIFGYAGVIQTISHTLAFQKIAQDDLQKEVKSLGEKNRQFIHEKIQEGKARFYVLKDAMSHDKMYLLKDEHRTRVITGTANFSERALSGKQSETLIIFDDQPTAWNDFSDRFQKLKKESTTHFEPDFEIIETPIEKVAILKEVQSDKTAQPAVLLPVDNAIINIQTVVRRVEKLETKYRKIAEPVVNPQKGKFIFNQEVVGKIITLAKNRTQESEAEEPPWLSINRDSKQVLLNGENLRLDTDRDKVQSDAELLFQYFQNYEQGFLGDVVQHQKDYFMFMSWLYLTPFICDFRNRVIASDDYIFNYPLFAILYGKSNSGKTQLITTLLTSMFGHYRFIEKDMFTRSNLRGFLATMKRLPVVFDDVEKTRFSQHGFSVIKDETILEVEYPAFVLSMNAENHSFPTEIRKRCLMLFSKASLPDDSPAGKYLYSSVSKIRRQLSTSFYFEYLKRVLHKLDNNSCPEDILKFSSEIIIELFQEALPNQKMPKWCTPVSIDAYRHSKYDNIKNDLLQLYDANPNMWDIRRNEVILTFDQAYEAAALRKELPDHLLLPGNKGTTVVMERKYLEVFLEKSLGRTWFERLLARNRS